MKEFRLWLDWIRSTLRNTGAFKFGPPVASKAVEALHGRGQRGVDAGYVTCLEVLGECHLFRELNYYRLGAISPVEVRDAKFGLGVVVGYSDGGDLGYWKTSTGGDQLCFRSLTGGRLQPSDFKSWFRTEFDKVRASYSRLAWRELVKAPRRFSKAEMQIVAARASFRWRQLEEGLADRLIFEVENLSDIVLPYLSIGVRWEDGSIGGVWIDVSHVAPGARWRIEKPLSAGRSAVGAKAFDLGSPEPGMQDRFWEFRKLEANRDAKG